MKRFLTTMAALFLMSGILAAASVCFAEPVTIGVSLDNLDDPFWVGIKTGIDAAEKELGDKVKINIQVCQGDANVQNKQIQDMVTAGAQAIVCVYVDKEAILQSVKLCNEKNVPFIYCDRTLDSTPDAQVAWGIATDNYALTVNGWKWMADYARSQNIKLKVLELVGSLTDNNVLRRTKGFEDVMKDNSDIIERVQSVPTEFNLEKALAGTTNALQADPDINCIFMHSDYLLAPTIQALEAAGRYVKIGEPGHVIVMPFSGNSGSVKAMKDGYVEMTFGMDVYKCGYEAIFAGYNIATGSKTYDAPADDPGFILTQENLSETAPRAYGSF
ncbi:MAG: sugar ABC transporter substrate-binding protein [Synergistaceae bacterium]|jgi:inositol transport system substrate-binding protein|nr:sugar ABC transporter substrate-binding protein [Synergistaceae bacterium]